MALEKLVTLQEAAVQTGIDRWCLYRAIKAGQLRASRPRHRWYVAPSDLETWLMQHSNVRPAAAQ